MKLLTLLTTIFLLASCSKDKEIKDCKNCKYYVVINATTQDTVEAGYDILSIFIPDNYDKCLYLDTVNIESISYWYKGKLCK